MYSKSENILAVLQFGFVRMAQWKNIYTIIYFKSNLLFTIEKTIYYLSQQKHNTCIHAVNSNMYGSIQWSIIQALRRQDTNS